MTLTQKLSMILRGERKLTDVWHYFLGNYRYWLFYHQKEPRLKYFIRPHIREQIEFRIDVMDKECYNSGSCKICGCETTALQMCNKPCDKPCYPSMMNRREWNRFKIAGTFKDSEGTWILFKDLSDNSLTLTRF